MNRNSVSTKLFFLVTALSIGFGVGFASATTHAELSSENNMLYAYSHISSGTPDFRGFSHSTSSSKVEAEQYITTSCILVKQMPKPLSVYRQRFCTTDTTPDNKLAHSPATRFAF